MPDHGMWANLVSGKKKDKSWMSSCYYHIRQHQKRCLGKGQPAAPVAWGRSFSWHLPPLLLRDVLPHCCILYPCWLRWDTVIPCSWWHYLSGVQSYWADFHVCWGGICMPWLHLPSSLLLPLCFLWLLSWAISSTMRKLGLLKHLKHTGLNWCCRTQW